MIENILIMIAVMTASIGSLVVLAFCRMARISEALGNIAHMMHGQCQVQYQSADLLLRLANAEAERLKLAKASANAIVEAVVGKQAQNKPDSIN
jgi:hypothetical protein